MIGIEISLYYIPYAHISNRAQFNYVLTFLWNNKAIRFKLLLEEVVVNKIIFGIIDIEMIKRSYLWIILEKLSGTHKRFETTKLCCWRFILRISFAEMHVSSFIVANLFKNTSERHYAKTGSSKWCFKQIQANNISLNLN